MSHPLCWGHGPRASIHPPCICQRLTEAEQRARVALWIRLKQRHTRLGSAGGRPVCAECRTFYPCATLTEVEAEL